MDHKTRQAVYRRIERDRATKVVTFVAGGMILGSFVLPNLNKVVRLAALHKHPTIYPFRALAQAGGLMTYDADILGSPKGATLKRACLLKHEVPEV